MTEAARDHGEFLDVVVAALNGPFTGGAEKAMPETGPLRELATQEAWELGGFGKLWRMRRDGFVFDSAGVLAPHGERMLGCIRYRRESEPDRPARSVFVLQTEEGQRHRVVGVYAETSLAVGWLRGWIAPGQRLSALPGGDLGRELASDLADAPRERLAERVMDRLDVGEQDAQRISRELPEGRLVVLAVHSLPVVGRTIFGLGEDGDGPVQYREGLWFVIEHDQAPKLISVLSYPSLTHLLNGARSSQAENEVDLFVDRITAVVREAQDNEARDPDQERYRDEITQRLESAFEGEMPTEQQVVEALKSALIAGASEGKQLGQLVVSVLEQLAESKERSR